MKAQASQAAHVHTATDMTPKKPTQTAAVARMIELAIQHHKSGNLAQAERMYRQALEREPANSDVLYFLGAIEYQTGKYAAAEDHLRRAIRIHAAAPAYHNGLGLVLQGLGRFDEAVNCFEAALKVNPQFVEAFAPLFESVSQPVYRSTDWHQW